MKNAFGASDETSNESGGRQTALVAGADEVHQIWLPGHVAAWDDWFADVAGITLALAGLRWGWRGRNVVSIFWPYKN